MFKNRTFGALAALLLVGGATVWKVTRPDPHAASSAPSPGAAAFHVDKADVDELEITEPKKPAVILRKAGAEWRLAAPAEDRADQKGVEQALEALATVKLKDVIAEKPESYDTVGVKDEDVVKVVARKGGKALGTLLLGKVANVRVEGDPRVFSTANLKRFALVKEPRLWRDRMIAELPADKLDHMTLEYPGGAKLVVGRQAAEPPKPAEAADPKAPPPPPPADKWIVTAGMDLVGGPLDDAAAGSVATGLARLEADDVADGTNATVTGLDAPRLVVTATLKDGTAKAFAIGKEDGSAVYVAPQGATRIWKVQKYLVDRLPASPADWRDKTVLRLDPSTVTRLEITTDKERTVLARVDAAGFKAEVPADVGELDPAKVNGLLRGAQALRASHILPAGDARAAGLEKPRGVLAFTRKDGSVVKLTIGAALNGEAVATVSTQKEPFLMPDYQAGNFLKSGKDLKKAGPQAGAPPGHL